MLTQSVGTKRKQVFKHVALAVCQNSPPCQPLFPLHPSKNNEWLFFPPSGDVGGMKNRTVEASRPVLLTALSSGQSCLATSPRRGLGLWGISGQARPSATAALEETIVRVSRKTPCASQHCLLARLQRPLGRSPAAFLGWPLLLRASCGREHPRAGKALNSGLFPAKNLPDAILHIFEMAPRVSFSVEGRRFNASFVLCS